MTLRTLADIPLGKLEEVGKRPGSDPRPLFRFARADSMRGRLYRMTLIKPFEDVGQAEAMLCRIHQVYAELFEALKSLKTRALEGDAEVTKEVAVLSREVTKAMNNLNDAEARLNAIRRKETGVVHDFAIDFDKARSEIRGRLDRIIDAQGAGGVSGSTE